jgi:hypothetical protein
MLRLRHPKLSHLTPHLSWAVGATRPFAKRQSLCVYPDAYSLPLCVYRGSVFFPPFYPELVNMRYIHPPPPLHLCVPVRKPLLVSETALLLVSETALLLASETALLLASAKHCATQKRTWCLPGPRSHSHQGRGRPRSSCLAAAVVDEVAPVLTIEIQTTTSTSGTYGILAHHKYPSYLSARDMGRLARASRHLRTTPVVR